MNHELSEDHALQRAVVAALPLGEIGSAQIGVSVHAGVVTLFGHVRSAAQKRVAQEAILRVDGVKAVAVAIQIRNVRSAKWHDDQIALEATTRLAWDAAVPPGVVKISVERARLTLFGELARAAQRAAVLEDVSRLFGVAAVRDCMTVKA
jgi:osmotically-inducible protein OsmY